MDKDKGELILDREHSKICPFLDNLCIGDRCELRVTLAQQVLGGKQVSCCVFKALLVMSAKQNTPVPRKKIILPNLRR